MHRQRALTLLPLLLVAGACRANNCEAISATIDAKIRLGGMVNFSLVTVDNAAPKTGRVVGSCDNGSKQIVYAPGPGGAGTAPGAGSAAASGAMPGGAVVTRPRLPRNRDETDSILTECKDGSVVVGPDCGKLQAMPMPNHAPTHTSATGARPSKSASAAP